jgi:Uncharacterized conserved protein
MGDPQQFADALRQFADMLSYRGGPVNWDLAKNVARHAIVAAGDPSVLDAQRREITEAVRLADLWLDEAAEFPSGIRKIEAWSRSEWLEATFPVWAKLCDPIAAKGVEAMSGMFTADPAQLGEDIPEEMRQALGALGGPGGLGGLGAMMRQLGGAMIGSQTGTAVGELAREVIGSADIGLPLGPEGTAALLPAGVADVRPRAVRRRRRGPALPRPARGRAPAPVRARAVAARAPARRGRAVRQRHLRRHGAPAGGHARRRHHQPRGDQRGVVRRGTVPAGGHARPEGRADPAGDRAGAGGGLGRDRGQRGRDRTPDTRRRPGRGDQAAPGHRRPAERTFATLVGLELRPRRLREATAIWQGLTEARGIDGRDALWAHPDLLPTADDLENPDTFVRGQPEFDISDLENPEDSGPKSQDEGD